MGALPSMPPKKAAKDDKKGAKGKLTSAKSGGGKAKKKKWSAGKVREKLINAVVLDQGLHDKIVKEVPAYRLITPAVVSERMKVNGSVARRCIQMLHQKGLIRPVMVNSHMKIYTRAVGGDAK